jgi:hypothetical protein
LLEEFDVFGLERSHTRKSLGFFFWFFFTLQIIIKVLGSWAALMLEIFDKYGEGEFDFSKG